MKPITELAIGHVGKTIHVTDDSLDVTGTLNHLKVRAWRGVVQVDVETIRGDLTAHYFEITLHISGNTIRPTLNARWKEAG